MEDDPGPRRDDEAPTTERADAWEEPTGRRPAPYRWIFGYGSLIWRPSFRYHERRCGYIDGWARRFWQRSTDHRGTALAPGRVVTLIEEPGARCWGMAYSIAAADLAAVLDHLDIREQQGYARLDLPVHLAGEGALACEVPAIAYIATADNPHFTGGEPLEAIADIIRTARGPSGDNVEYVVELARALSAMGASDPHVEELALLVGASR
jgi:glutathione-specific gamma-glutamylcyclotransferase